MRIRIQEEPQAGEVEIVIRCQSVSREIVRIVEALRKTQPGEASKLTGWREGQTYILQGEDVLYADTADKRTFLYTAGEVFESSLRLYELEERLAGQGFLRAGKSCLVNFNAIRSLRPDLGGRLQLTMSNGENIYVSRQYAPAIKNELGI